MFLVVVRSLGFRVSGMGLGFRAGLRAKSSRVRGLCGPQKITRKAQIVRIRR